MKKKVFVEKESQKFVLVSLHATVKKHAWWLVEHGDNNGKIVSSVSLKNHFEKFKQ
jgi:hypothetical protein